MATTSAKGTATPEKRDKRSRSLTAKMALAGFLVIGIASALAGAACASKPSPTTTVPTTALQTVADFAREGASVYTARCANCHGSQGQGASGPPLKGSSAALDRYGNAAALYDFISKAMPFNAPGTLPSEEYQRVLAYLINENGLVETSKPFDVTNLQAMTFTPP